MNNTGIEGGAGEVAADDVMGLGRGIGDEAGDLGQAWLGIVIGEGDVGIARLLFTEGVVDCAADGFTAWLVTSIAFSIFKAP